MKVDNLLICMFCSVQLLVTLDNRDTIENVMFCITSIEQGNLGIRPRKVKINWTL